MRFLSNSKQIFKVFGVPIKLHPTWFFIFVLIIFSLSYQGGFLRRYLGDAAMSEVGFWILGTVCALLMFVSLLAHELAHSLMARRFGMPIRGITLFIFGGVSELGEEPRSAAAEFFMAIVGPLSSLVIGGVCLGLLYVGEQSFTWPPAGRALLMFLGTINILLAMFNSMPAFPLDGGRVMRSALWAVTGDLRQSTQVAATIGSGFGLVMILSGVLAVFGVPPFVQLLSTVGGIWLIFIGLFVRQAASSSLKQVVMRQALGGEPVGRFMTVNPVTVNPALTLRRFVDDYVLPYHYAVFPVVDAEGKLIGVIHALDPRKVAPAEWDMLTVGDIMHQPPPAQTVSPESDAADALTRLRGEQGRRLIVVYDGRPVGIVSLRDMLEFISLKVDLAPRSWTRSGR